MVAVMGILNVVVTVHGQVAIHDTRLRRPSLPDVKGAADDIMDEEEFKLVEDFIQKSSMLSNPRGEGTPPDEIVIATSVRQMRQNFGAQWANRFSLEIMLQWGLSHRDTAWSRQPDEEVPI